MQALVMSCVISVNGGVESLLEWHEEKTGGDAIEAETTEKYSRNFAMKGVVCLAGRQ